MNLSNYTIEELENEIQRQIDEANKARKIAQSMVKPRYKFTIYPTDQKYMQQQLIDDSCIFYYLEGKIVNKKECEEVGHSNFFEGGIHYLYNKLNKKFVMRDGGGSVFVVDKSDFSYNKERDLTLENGAAITIDRIERFLELYPNGGDITEIVEAHRTEREL